MFDLIPSQSPEEAQEFQLISDKEQGEQIRTIRQRISCVDYYHNMDEMISFLEEASKEGPVDIFALPEYGVDLESFVQRLPELKQFAQEKNTQIIVAPKGNRAKSIRHFSWGEVKQLLERENVEYENIMNDEESVDSVGFYISPQKVYAFPKTMRAESIRPLHIIPGTRIGVAVCGEIHHLNLANPNDLKKIDIIFNPSQEGDDPSLIYRMMKQYGKSDEEIRTEVRRRHPSTTAKERRDDLEKQLTPRQIAELKKAHLWDINEDEEKNRKSYDEGIEWYLTNINEKQYDSPYLEDVPQEIKSKIPIIRTDGEATGLLNQIDGLKFDGLDCKKEHCYLDFSYQLS